MNTKSKFLTTLFFCTCAIVLTHVEVSAQQSTARAGIKGGLNVSNLYAGNVDDANARYGFNIGIYGQIFSTPTFAIQPELLYTTKGAEAIYNTVLGDQTTRFSLNYLELPVLAVFKLGPSAEIHAGGYASYLVNANVKYSGIVNGTDELNRSNFKSGDAGLVGGFGLNFGSIQVGARYNLGLVEIANSTAARTLLGDSKNSCATLYIAFNLNH